MPYYVCTASKGRLTSAQKTDIARAITAIYHEETGAPRYLVQVIFNEVLPGDHYVGGLAASSDQIWVRCDTRSGKTEAEKKKMTHRTMEEVADLCGADREAVSFLVDEIPSTNIAEFGQIAPAAGEEEAWFASLSETLQQRLKAMA